MKIKEIAGNILSGAAEKWRNLSKRLRVILTVVVCCVLAALIGFGAWFWFAPTRVYGMDASHYQGDISWKAVKANSSVSFVYLKATEGKGYVDARFKSNLAGAEAAGLKVGAYHFFSTTSSGEAQAANFIRTVPKKAGMLPPAVDIESTVTKEAGFKKQVSAYVKKIEAYYGQKPVFYVPARIFNMLYDSYSNYPFWVINVKTKPDIGNWTFWQYDEKGTLAGVDGDVDLDQFQGSRFAFLRLLS